MAYLTVNGVSLMISAMEKKIHEKKGVTFDAVREYRLEKEVPVLEGFWKWLDAQHAAKGTRMYKALT